ncbi:MAG: CPBP family intramembrane metalloprotease [Acidimicrobiia bacterium]|nr:CPBP family intramembrane metalloprotease [Acidimicrobiia bacterium]
MENISHDNTQLSDKSESKIPRFGTLAGVGAILTYLLASLPLVAIAGLIVALNSSKENGVNNDLSSSEVSNKINDLIAKPGFIIAIIAANCIGLYIWVFLVSKIRGSKNIRDDFGLHFTKSAWWFIPVGIGLQLLSLILSLPISLLKDNLKNQDVAVGLVSAKGAILFLYFLFVALIVPFTEELCFRGVFLRGILRRYKPILSILICGILFASIHLSDKNAFYGFSSLMIIGIFSSALTVYRGRIDASIALHIGFNLTAAIFLVIT